MTPPLEMLLAFVAASAVLVVVPGPNVVWRALERVRGTRRRRYAEAAVLAGLGVAGRRHRSRPAMTVTQRPARGILGGRRRLRPERDPRIGRDIDGNSRVATVTVVLRCAEMRRG